MSKINNFAKAFKKSLYKSGEKLELYGNTYTVMSCSKSYTLLKDSKGTPCAYPTESVRKMLLQKSLGDVKKAVPGQADKMHAGKIRVDKVDKHGKKYHYWVDATHGTKHEDHGADPHKHQLDETSMKLHGKMNSIINEHAHQEDVPKLKKMLNEFVEAKAAHSHLKEAHNQLAKEQGGVHSSTLQQVASKQDAADQKLNKLKDALKASKQKKLKGANNE